MNELETSKSERKATNFVLFQDMPISKDSKVQVTGMKLNEFIDIK